MFEKSLSGISKAYYISNKKIYTRSKNNYKISNVEKFDAEKFALWMQKGFRESSLKTIKALAAEVKSNPATISRLLSGAPQTTTNKRSQPNRDLVVRLALLFKEDIDEALILAGHAPSGEPAIEIKIGENVRLRLLGADYYTDEERKEFAESLEVALEIAKRRIAEKKKENN